MRALVVGGATGIGRAAAEALRDRGDAVVVADVAAVEIDGVAAVRADLADPGAPAAVASQALELLGGVDLLLCTAGILESRPLAQWDQQAWERSVAVNLTAPFLLVQALAPALAESSCGRIVLTSSTGAFRGHARMHAYHATKAGLLGLVRSLADELGPSGVTVNALCPGWVDTPFNDAFWSSQADPDGALQRLVDGIPLGRQATPDDIVGIVLFLASSASRYVTGQSLVIDGGYTAV